MLDIPTEKAIILLENTIIPSLSFIGLNSKSAIELVLGTAIKESLLKYREQIGGGPALGLWQMEPNTFYDIWDNYLIYHKALKSKIEKFFSVFSHKTIKNNDELACIMCRIHYLRVPKPLPKQGDIQGHAIYWKTYYNTIKGRGKKEDYVKLWNIFTNSKELQRVLNEIT